MSRLRAVEFGRTVVVAATSGISAIVAPDGTVVRGRRRCSPRRSSSRRSPSATPRTVAQRLGAGAGMGADRPRCRRRLLVVVRQRRGRGTAVSDRVLVIVPTYDEVENLERILDRLHAACPPRTRWWSTTASRTAPGELADKLAAADPRVHVLHRTAKAGLGPAYVAGFRWARERGYDVVVEMDADGSHAPEQLPGCSWPPSATADLVARLAVRARGSGGRLAGAPAAALARRQPLHPLGAAAAAHATRPAGTAPPGGELIDALPFDDVASQGYCFQVDWAWRAVRAGARVREVPITFTERAFGRSKMSGSIVREALVRVTVWGLRDRLADWLPGRVARPVPARARDRGR